MHARDADAQTAVPALDLHDEVVAAGPAVKQARRAELLAEIDVYVPRGNRRLCRKR
jgi:hypothetical protein